MEVSAAAMNDERDKLEIARLTDQLLPKLRSAVVPIYFICESKPVVPVQIGTGTLFRVADRSFLVTASHVFRVSEAHSGGLYTHDMAQGAEFVPLNGQYHIDDDNDVTVLSLTERQTESLPTRKFLRVCETDRTLRQPDDGWYVVHGYPTCWSIVEVEKESAISRPYTRITRLYQGRTVSFDEYDCRRHVLLDHTNVSTLAPTSLKSDQPDGVHGISGCSIWQVFRDGDSIDSWIPEKARIIGVETGVFKDGRIVKGTRWAFVYHIIYTCFPELRSPLEIIVPEKAPPNGNLEGLTRLVM
jgi:hypothetical protein